LGEKGSSCRCRSDWSSPHKKDHIRVVDEAAQFLRTASRARAAIVLDITEGAKPILAKLRSRQSQ